jgi:ubiquinone biosynthesis protein UbiJ
MALRSTFQPEAARGVHVGYEVHVGEMVIHARVDDGALEVAAGTLAGADLVIEAGPVIKALMADEMTPADAIENGLVRLTGDAGLLNQFVELFHIAPIPA